MKAGELEHFTVEGRGLDQNASVALALTDDPDEPLRALAPDHPSDDPLSPRECEVAALIARGLTNRHIAKELVITEGTAGLHVVHILNKLGFSNRAQAATWVATHARKPAAADGRR
jgi:DNA-binding NarL/FixJ family response regulator